MLTSLSTSDQARFWEEFLQHPCWMELKKIAETQMRVREDTVLSNIYSVEHELLKGERLGIGLFLEIPQTVLEGLEVDLARMEHENAT